jgi:rhamnulokinase
MTAAANFAAVDLGASSGRLMAGQWDGAKFKLQDVHRFPNAGVRIGKSLFWNVLEIWSQIQAGLVRYRNLFPELPSGIGVDAWGVDYALLDRQDELLGNPYHYRDERTQGAVESVARTFSNRDLFALTGVQTMPINTLFQLHAGASKSSYQLAEAKTLLMLPDLFQFFLCGEKRAEYTEATTTQLYSLPRRRWVEQLMLPLGISPEIFPQVTMPGTVLGPVRETVLADCGFQGAFTAIAVGSHDTASAVSAIPQLDNESAFVSSGTWSLMGIVTSEPNVSPEAFHLGFTNEGAADGGVLLLKNLTGLWVLQECQRNWSADGHHYEWDWIEQAASSAAPFRSWIDANAREFQSPCDMPAAIQGYCAETGQPVPQTPGEIARCVFESLSFGYRKVLDELQQLTRRDLRVLRVVGGGARNRFLCQMTADATRRNVVAGPAEATAFGNVMVQAVATGHIKDLAAGRRAMMASVECHSYEPASTGGWEDAYARFRSLLSSGKAVAMQHE